MITQTNPKSVVANREIAANYKFFQKMKSEWQKQHLAEYALLRKCKLVAFFESETDAINTGVRDYGWGNFSVQPVRDEVVDLGFQSYVLF